MNKGLKVILINLGAMLVIVVVALFILFNVYLPNYTRHGETITVPNLVGMHQSELANFMKSKDLRFEIVDSSYIRGQEPGVVVSQRPKPETLVKENRKIYININATEVPMVKVPKVEGEALNNARSKLVIELGFILDSIRYQPSNNDGMVLDLIYEGKSIDPGKEIPKNSILTLVVGRKGESREVSMPDVFGMPASIAKRMILNEGLQVGLPIYEPNSSVEVGYVYKQNPVAGTILHSGDMVDIWVNQEAGYEGPAFNDTTGTP